MATAAPFTPNPSFITNNQSNIIFATAPTPIIIIDKSGLPSVLTIGFKAVANIYGIAIINIIV